MSLSEETLIPQDASQEIDESLRIVQYIAGKGPGGEDCWAYAVLRPSRYEEYYTRVSAGETIDILDYGEIMEHGLGDEPPQHIQDGMVERFGFSKEEQTRLESLGKEAIKKIQETENGQEQK